jgi:hypothetical protein
MVQVVNYQQRVTEDGKQFFVLNLEGDVEFVRSETTGNTYATVKKCNLSTTFSELTCKRLIGTQLPGRIAKVECKPFEYANPATGEVMTLNHRNEYCAEEEIHQHQSPMSDFKEFYNASQNGKHQILEPTI